MQSFLFAEKGREASPENKFLRQPYEKVAVSLFSKKSPFVSFVGSNFEPTANYELNFMLFRLFLPLLMGSHSVKMDLFPVRN